jgi:hypothetical protein
VRRVVPEEIVSSLHRQGKMTKNGAFEVGLDLSNETCIDNLRASAWFLPWELSPTEAIQRRSGAPSSPASSEPRTSVPPVAASPESEPAR